MASTEQLGRLAKAWRRAVEALPLLYDFVVPFLPPIAKYAMAGLLVVGGHDLYEEQFHYDESASALADKMYSRLDARIQEAEAALVAQYAEAGKKIAVVEAGYSSSTRRLSSFKRTSRSSRRQPAAGLMIWPGTTSG